MLTWTTREPQKNTPADWDGRGEASDVEAPFEDGRNLRRDEASNDGVFSFPQPNSKAVANLAAQLALAGRELHVIPKASGRTHFEVRHWNGECFACSTLHDVAGIAARMQPARPMEVM